MKTDKNRLRSRPLPRKARNGSTPMRPAIAPHDDGRVPLDTDKIVGRSKLLGELRELIRRSHYSIRSEIERLFAQMDGTPQARRRLPLRGRPASPRRAAAAHPGHRIRAQPDPGPLARVPSSAPSSRLSSPPASTNTAAAIRCATRLQRTCLSPATISAPSRSCSATRMCARR